jgi:hypothetical protein
VSGAAFVARKKQLEVQVIRTCTSSASRRAMRTSNAYDRTMCGAVPAIQNKPNVLILKNNILGLAATW